MADGPDVATGLRGMAVEAVETAVGHRHRDDPITGRTGGPAGNAKLTAWTGLLLLVLFVVEVVTLLDVHGLVSWHIAIGALLVPPALLKTVTTGWRILRYYAGSADYHVAGPPPTALRVLGPLVIASTLAVLGTGIALVLLGQSASHQTIVRLLGQRVDAITLHQASFAVWAVVTGLHTLGRLVPAAQTTILPDGETGSAVVPGSWVRATLVAATLALAVPLAVVLVGAGGDWHHRLDRGPEDRPRLGSTRMCPEPVVGSEHTRLGCELVRRRSPGLPPGWAA